MSANKLNAGKRPLAHKSLDISVDIYDSVLERITCAVLHSATEVGGKFLGSIARDGQQVRIQVESYIDSGPRAQNSAIHLYPDGDYQEAVFRLVEIFKPEIEHIGSWHSHHCNKLADLSMGDIRGYFKSVNHPNYNLDYFFVLLVIDCRDDGVELRYFLFCRGEDCFYEIEKTKAQVVQKVSLFEPLLSQAEQVAHEYRKRSQSDEQIF